tara:strand:- start:1527 stop:1985 length:459 start_codon:yes stop_codon:yes gene_type:complete
MKKIKKNSFIFFFLLLTCHSLANENLIFLSLKNNEVNVRVGPSKEYPIKFTYNKKYFPVKILDKSGTWRKIIDFQNNSGWIHISQLSKKKSAINIKNNTIIYKKSTIFSKPIAKVENGKLLIVKKCKKKWCKITAGEFEGWVPRNSLWGKIK